MCRHLHFPKLNNICHFSDHLTNLSMSSCKFCLSPISLVFVNNLVSSANFNIASKVNGAAVALQCLTDDYSNFIRESTNRKTIFKDWLCPVKFLLHSINLVMLKLSPHTYRRYRRTRTRVDLQEHERQVCTIKNCIGAVCFF